jgi:hypothetical protein
MSSCAARASATADAVAALTSSMVIDMMIDVVDVDMHDHFDESEILCNV